MLKPNESLDDYVVRALPEPAEPPLPVSLRFTGEVEVLKPLARWERPVKLVPAGVESAPQRLSWFHRSLVMGGGFAVAALVLASAIVIGVSDATSGPETAQIDFIEVPAGGVEAVTPEEPLSADIFSAASAHQPEETAAFRIRKYRKTRVNIARSNAPVRTRLRKPFVRPNKEPNGSLVSRFVPTTLIIYIENGFIRSRTEPWLADHK